MSMSQRRSPRESEGIEGISRRGGSDVRFQSLLVHDIDRAVEQRRNVFLEAHVIPDPDVSLRINLDQNIDVAVGPIVAARVRTEQSRVTDATRPQGGLVLLELGEDFLTIHNPIIAS